MNLFFKFLPSLVITIFTTVLTSHAQTSGSGCNVNGEGIFTTKIGTSHYYGSATDIRPVYLNSTASGNFVPRNVMGYKESGNHYNYMCGYVNEFSSSYGPNQQELVMQTPEVLCEVAASASTPSDQSSHGRMFNFTYNNSTYCSATKPNNAPLDDYLPALVSIASIGAFFIIRRNDKLHSVSLLQI